MKAKRAVDFGTMRQDRYGKLLRYSVFILVAALLLLAPPLVGAYAQSWITQVLIYGIFALSLNLLSGYGGLFSLGHAAFFGVGAYIAGIMMTTRGITSFWLVAPAGILAATLCALLFGFIALRTSGIYFLFVTMALGELLDAVATSWVSVTGGSNGVVGIPYPNLGLPFAMNVVSFYYLVVVVFAVCLFLMYRFVKCPFGLALQGIRDDELRMRHLGYNTWLHKYITFVVAGAFAGVAGVLSSSAAAAVTPGVLGGMTSALVMLMVAIGGMRPFLGPVIGAVVILFLQYYASIFIPSRWPLVLGGAFVITVMFLRGGIGIYLARLWEAGKVQPWKS
jgi:branched-chain amino acid transport system permease protein